MSLLILVRHGQSTWNLENRFTGEVDVDLTPLGEQEAAKAGELLKPFRLDQGYTSVLVRAIRTMDIILEAIGHPLPIERSAALNERNYGDLQGLNKAETEKKYGKAQVHEWRRSFNTRPPGGESLADTVARVLPYYRSRIEIDIRDEKNVLVVAHGNSLRALMMYLEEISEQAIAELNLATGIPRVYEFEAAKLKKAYYLGTESQKA